MGLLWKVPVESELYIESFSGGQCCTRLVYTNIAVKLVEILYPGSPRLVVRMSDVDVMVTIPDLVVDPQSWHTTGPFGYSDTTENNLHFLDQGGKVFRERIAVLSPKQLLN